MFVIAQPYMTCIFNNTSREAFFFFFFLLNFKQTNVTTDVRGLTSLCFYEAITSKEETLEAFDCLTCIISLEY